MKLAEKQKTHRRNEFPELCHGIYVIRYRGQHAVATGAKDIMQRFPMAPRRMGKEEQPRICERQLLPAPTRLKLEGSWEPSAHLAWPHVLTSCRSVSGWHFALLSNVVWHLQSS